MFLPCPGGQHRRTTRTPRRRGRRDPRTYRGGSASGPATMGGGGLHRPGNRSVRRLSHLGAAGDPAPQRTRSRRIPRTTRHLRNLQITTPCQPTVPNSRDLVHESRGRTFGTLHLAPTSPSQYHSGPSPSHPQRSRRPRTTSTDTCYRRGGLNADPLRRHEDPRPQPSRRQHWRGAHSGHTKHAQPNTHPKTPRLARPPSPGSPFARRARTSYTHWIANNEKPTAPTKRATATTRCRARPSGGILHNPRRYGPRPPLGPTTTPEGRAFRPHQTRATNTPHQHTPRQTLAEHPRCHAASEEAAHPKRQKGRPWAQNITTATSRNIAKACRHTMDVSVLFCYKKKAKCKRKQTNKTTQP